MTIGGEPADRRAAVAGSVEPVIVSDATDPRLHDYTCLTDVALRRRREPDEGMFVAEGEKVIRRAVAAGYPMRSALLAPRWLPGLADVLAGCTAPVYVADESVLQQVTGYAVHRGALASIARLPLPTVEQVLADARTAVVLEDVNDHTNVGLVFRSAAGLGIDAVVLAPRCADPLYRRAVKTSMGAVFALPYARMTSWYDGLAELASVGFETMALTLDPAAPELEAAFERAGDRVALLIGSEGHGLSPRWQHQATTGARIPMVPGVDSLNLAAAAAIACYTLARRQ